MPSLPSITPLRSRCQSLAALDLILSPEWGYRYFSFNSQWAPGKRTGSFVALDSGAIELMSLLVSPPDAYVRHVFDSFELEIDVAMVEHVFAQRPITNSVVKRINAETDLEKISSELFVEIAYPK